MRPQRLLKSRGDLALAKTPTKFKYQNPLSRLNFVTRIFLSHTRLNLTKVAHIDESTAPERI